MKIAAHLGVLDEIELIAPAIDHLRRIGVEHVIAFDMGSRDGTLEILEGYCGEGFDLVRLNNSTPWEELHSRTIESIRKVGADWVLLLDADEFWLPATGSLHDCLALAENDIVTVDRFNVALTTLGLAMPACPGPESYSRTYLYNQPVPDFRRHLESHPDIPWISGVPVPKVLGRSEFIEAVAMGGHDIDVTPGRAIRRTRAADLVIAHVPFSSFERFKRRIDNITEFFELNPGYFTGGQGWHWKRLYELARQGREREEFDRQVIDPLRLAELVGAGRIRSAAEILGT